MGFDEEYGMDPVAPPAENDARDVLREEATEVDAAVIETVERIEETYRQWDRYSTGGWSDLPDVREKDFSLAEDYVEDLEPGREAVYRFCERVQAIDRQYRHEDADFLSALLQQVPGDDPVRVPAMPDIPNLGKKNDGKHLIIEGDAGPGVGRMMRSGTIEVRGDVRAGTNGPTVGWWMQGGEILLYRDGKPGDTDIGDVYRIENGERIQLRGGT